MVMAGLTEFPGLFAAGADLFGIVNFETFFHDTEPWMAAISTVEYGDPKTQPELLKQLSPIHKLDRIRTPTIVLHGANDTNVPVVEAEQVVATLKKNGVPVQYVLFPTRATDSANRIRAAVEMTRFFRRYLVDQPRPPPGPPPIEPAPPKPVEKGSL
jgi:dipeptidyl aminopeptidase/acylaminoacyl peptidase